LVDSYFHIFNSVFQPFDFNRCPDQYYQDSHEQKNGMSIAPTIDPAKPRKLGIQPFVYFSLSGSEEPVPKTTHIIPLFVVVPVA
jgi:hypothetical protein